MTSEEFIKGLIDLGFKSDGSDDDIYTLEEKNCKERRRVVLESNNYKSYRVRIIIDWATVKTVVSVMRYSGGWDKYGTSCYVDKELASYIKADDFVDKMIEDIRATYCIG